MSVSTLPGKTVDVKIWAPVDQIEPQALAQIQNVAAMPWVFHHVAIMADAHYGVGATVGSVIAMKAAVSPAAVGVDLGCGMVACRTSLRAENLPYGLGEIRSGIEAVVPVGFQEHREAKSIEGRLMHRFVNLTPQVQSCEDKARRQLGTLGGGNHFVEICLDTLDQVWIMLHSGSRNIGKSLADYHIGVARKLAHNQDLPDRDLAVFLSGTQEMRAYLHDLYWAQEYAKVNREIMMKACLQVLAENTRVFQLVEIVACHHNYVAEELHFGETVFVTRKGAIRAGAGVRGIIPGSMGTQSYIVTGKGNPESFESASHGAGRRMSRGEAKRRFTLVDLDRQTAGIECRKDARVLDEIPGAYKDIEQVMRQQEDLVTVDAVLRAVLCVKG